MKNTQLYLILQVIVVPSRLPILSFILPFSNSDYLLKRGKTIKKCKLSSSTHRVEILNYEQKDLPTLHSYMTMIALAKHYLCKPIVANIVLIELS